MRGEVREALLIPGERHAFEMREGLAIVRYRGTLRIASAVYEIRRREVEEIGP